MGLKQIAKLKIIAFFQRDKIRDLYDFGAILENKIVSFEDILQISQELKNISTKEQLIKFISDKKEEKDDEAVYLDEQNRVNLSFLEIKDKTIYKLAILKNNKVEAVLTSKDEYEAMKEALKEVETKKILQSTQSGLDDMKSGKTKHIDKLWDELSKI